MTNDELIKLAGDAGFSLGFSGNVYVGNVLVTDYLKSFADLVSAHAITSMPTEQPAALNNMSNTPESVQKHIQATAPNYGKEMVALMTSPNIKECVNRFLGWKLPKDFSPDCGISFKPYEHQNHDSHHWPIGTNLLNADQAKAMFEHVLAGATSELFPTPAPVTSMQESISEKYTSEPVGFIVESETTPNTSGAYAGQYFNSFYSKQPLKVNTKLFTHDRVKGVSDELLEKLITEIQSKKHNNFGSGAFNEALWDCVNIIRKAQSQLSTNTDGWDKDADIIGLIASRSIMNILVDAGVILFTSNKPQLQAKIQCAVINAISQPKVE